MSMEQWKAERLLKKAQKQARKSLETKGIDRKMANKMVKHALRRLAKEPVVPVVETPTDK